MTRDLIALMHEQLADHGIVLDDKGKLDAKLEPALEPSELPVDRVLVRRVLVDRGAFDRDLEWLTLSCQSLEAAQTYRPVRIAWCFECSGPQLADRLGCCECQRRGEKP